MNMHDTGPVLDVAAMNVIVALALLFAVTFFTVWAISPRLRAWIEKPNCRFQKDAQRYDETLRSIIRMKGRKTR
jgi:hypothetical protein